MRKPTYISYSSFKLFESDPEGFYRKYITATKQPREPQNHYMAIGSAFDAFVKAELHKRFVDDGDPRFQVQALFEEQVEPQVRDKGWADGQTVYEMYKKCGAFQDICNDLKGAHNIQFETTLEGEIEGGVILLGKPDIKFLNAEAARVVHDWKVNGFYSKNRPSPRRGYVAEYPGKKMHRLCAPFRHRGALINSACPMNLYCTDWAEQLTMYAWLLGEPIGGDYILTVDQLIVDKVYRYSALCDPVWQRDLYLRIKKCWDACQTGHIFLHLPYEQSLAKGEAIDAELTVVDKTVQRMLERER
jgi:hypothetical protein